jgi:hypothetical protein
MRSCSIPRLTSWLRETGLRGWASKIRASKWHIAKCALTSRDEFAHLARTADNVNA